MAGTCGCSTLALLSDGAEATSGCGCGCGDQLGAPRTREEEIAELRAMLEAVRVRLAELGAG